MAKTVDDLLAEHEWRERPPRPDDGIDRETGAPAELRVKAGVFDDPERKLQYVQKYLADRGGQMVAEGQRDQFGKLTGILLQKPGEKPVLFDEDRTTLRDILDWSGDAMEIGPAIAAGAAGTMAAGPAGGIAAAAATDAATAAARSALEDRMLGQEIDYGEAGKRAAVNAALGLAGEAGGAVIKAGARAAAPAVRAAASKLPWVGQGIAEREIARQAGGELAGQSSRAIAEQTGTEFHQRSMELEDYISDATGRRFQYSPGQATGAKSTLMRERTLSQTGETMDAMQRAQQKRLSDQAAFHDAITDRLAADPSKLSNQGVGEQVASAINARIKGLVDERSREVGPLFERAAQLAQGQPVFAERTQQELTKLIKQYDIGPGKKIAQPLKETLKSLGEGGEVSLEGMQQLMSFWSGVRAGDTTIIEGLSKRQEKRVAARLGKALESDLDAAAQGLGGEAAATLQEARRLWREHSEGIDSVATKSINKILKLSAQESDDKIVPRILRSSPKQVRAVVDILEKSDPMAADQLRAQVWKNLLGASGSGGTAPFGAVLSDAAVHPAKLKGLIRKHATTLETLFTDNKSRMDFKAVLESLDRLGSGPGIVGSDTAPKLWMGNWLSRAKEGGVVGAAASKLGEFIQNGGMSGEAIVGYMSTPEGIAAYNELVQAAYNPSRLKKGIAVAGAGLLRAIERLGRFEARDVLLHEPQPVTERDEGESPMR